MSETFAITSYTDREGKQTKSSVLILEFFNVSVSEFSRENFKASASRQRNANFVFHKSFIRIILSFLFIFIFREVLKDHKKV